MICCQAWAERADAQAFLGGQVVDDAQLDAALAVASDALFLASGQAWSGACVVTARPCSAPTRCFQILPDGGAGLLVSPDGAGVWGPGPWLWTGREWYVGAAGRALCSCTPLNAVRLDGPIASVEEVNIGGVIIDPASYRAEGEYLVRTDGAWWPACQDVAAAPGSAGAFTVRYTTGEAPPESGVRAAAELAAHVALAMIGSSKCRLPTGVTRVVRQGVTVERSAASMFARGGRTGLVLVDVFLDTVNPNRLQAPPSVWSPDIAQRARRTVA